MERETLRDYLEQIRLLEMDIYTMDRAMENLETTKRKQLPYPAEPVIWEPQLPPKPQYNKWEYGIVIRIILLLGSFWVITKVMPKDLSQNSYFNICLISFFAYCLLCIVVYVLETRKKHKKWKNGIAYIIQRAQDNANVQWNEYQEECDQIDRENQNITAVNGSIENEIVKLKFEKAKTEEVLDKLYSLNVIYPKYRGMIPVSMFCEYMDAHRRDKLEGKGEMYDLYEQELLARNILGSLSEINSSINSLGEAVMNKLDGIQRNQMLTYEAILEGNHIADQMREEAERRFVIESAQRAEIAASARATAYYARETARRTAAIERYATY